MQQSDVLIVGGGVIGIACAHYLNKAGAQVTVIDQGTVAGACSQGNCGYVCPSHVLPLTEPGAIKMALKSMLNPNAPFRVKPRLSPAMWRWMFEFARRCNHKQMLAAGVHLKAILDSAMAEYRRIVADENLECEWSDNGLLYVLRTKAGMDAFSHTDQIMTEAFGVSATRIAGDKLPQFDPALKPGLAGAFHYSMDASVRPDRLNQAWAGRLRERGVRFVERCAMKQIVTETGRVRHVETSRGPMSAGQYVFATGAWSAKLGKALGCSIPVQPGKGYSVTMKRPERCPKYPILFPEHRVGVSPFREGYRLGSMMEFAGYDTKIPPRRIAQLRRAAEPYLLDPHTPADDETWYGWRPMTWDSLPIIGPVPGKSNAFLATGHNMLGLSLASATGKLIGEMLNGQPTHIDASAFSPARF